MRCKWFLKKLKIAQKNEREYRMSNVLETLDMQIRQLTADISQLKQDWNQKKKLLRELQDTRKRYTDWKSPTIDIESVLSCVDSDEDLECPICTRSCCYCEEDNLECHSCIRAYCYCTNCTLIDDMLFDQEIAMVDEEMFSSVEEEEDEEICTGEQRAIRLYKSKYTVSSAYRIPEIPHVSHGAQRKFKLERTRNTRRRRAGFKNETREQI